MWNKLQNDWRPKIIFILFILMILGLFFSRAILSISMISFIIYSFFHPHVKDQLKKFISSPLLWSMCLLFFIPLVSGLWSEDKTEWLTTMRIKLPLLFMPLSFASPIILSKKDWERLSFLFILLILGGTVWSMFHYLSDPTATQQAYLQSRIIETPLENDHVRFSWLISIAILTAGWLGFKKIKTNSTFAWTLFVISIWLIIFLHILAARTGLLSFYIISFLFILWLAFKKMKLINGISFFMVLVSLPILAYFIFPTFQNRIKYFFYDLPYFKKAHYLPQTTDAVRVISMKAGWNIMNAKPLAGVGFGDIFSETKKWYEENYPSMKEEDKIYPSSEWLLYGGGSGWLGFILFTIIFAIPFFLKKIHNKFLWCVLNASILCLVLFDIGLEVQLGVFIYSFIMLCWWKRSTMENIKS